MKVEVINHPLVQHKLTYLRKSETKPRDFRKLLEEITNIVFIYATEHLSLKKITIDTPLERTVTCILDETILLVPILRAGVGMLNPILSLAPDARVEFIGLRRDEKTLEPIQYYSHFSSSHPDTTTFILDPMIATGGSALYTFECLSSAGLQNISIVSIITSQHAAQSIEKKKGLQLFTASVDPELNGKGYIVPGLGDAGDRIYDTF
ncbi:MAG: uracil phosphoribosyltransferase [Spirochaetota bacterium]|nr:MAG: uracil phosphoribosyltransferase [Spirochaetota bacterium]